MPAPKMRPALQDGLPSRRRGPSAGGSVQQLPQPRKRGESCRRPLRRPVRGVGLVGGHPLQGSTGSTEADGPEAAPRRPVRPAVIDRLDSEGDEPGAVTVRAPRAGVRGGRGYAGRPCDPTLAARRLPGRRGAGPGSPPRPESSRDRRGRPGPGRTGRRVLPGRDLRPRLPQPHDRRPSAGRHGRRSRRRRPARRGVGGASGGRHGRLLGAERRQGDARRTPPVDDHR